MSARAPGSGQRLARRQGEHQTEARQRSVGSSVRAAAWAVLTLSSGVCGCSGSTPASPATPAASPSAASAPIPFEFPSAGEDAVISSETTRGRATALVFITTFDLASQLVARRLADVVVAFTPRANAAAVVVEAPAYAELLPAYRAALSLPYPVVMADFATQRGAGPFGAISHVPTLLVLDREGREVWRQEGSVELDEIRAALGRASAR